MTSTGARLRILGWHAAAFLTCAGCSFDSSGQGSSTTTTTTTTTTSDTSTTQAETSETTDPGTTDPSTTDPETTDPSTTEEPLEDLPAGTCTVDTHPPLDIVVSNLEGGPDGCQEELATHVLASSSDEALSLVECGNSCLSCQDVEGMQLSLGPVDINTYIKLPGPSTCLFLETDGLLVADPEFCVYSAVTLVDPEFQELPELAATRDSWGLTSLAAELLGGWEPGLEPSQDCSCSEASPDYCCEGAVLSYMFSVNGELVPPGEPLSILIQDQALNFFGQQAQTGVTCGVNEISWLIAKI